MVTVMEFLVQLGVSVIEMFQTFLSDVLFTDPLSFISILVGGAFVFGAMGALGYLALGALARELGLLTPTPGRGARERRQRGGH
jgi:hypothetical protein